MSSTMIDGLVKVLIIVLTGVAQYLHLVPPGSFLPVVTLVAGYHAGQNIPSAVTTFLTSQNSAPVDNSSNPTTTTTRSRTQP